MVEVVRNTKKAAHPATEKKFRRLMRQMPGSFSGGLSCLGFFTAAAATGLGVAGATGLGARDFAASFAAEELDGGGSTFGTS